MSQSLPPELWRLILAYATLVDKVFDTSYTSPFDEWRDPIIFHVSHEQIMRTKQTVYTVCKAWRDMTFPSLFETIVVNRKNATKLLPLFTSKVDGPRRCQQIRLLDVDLGDGCTDRVAANVSRYFLRMFKSCSKLQIYKHRNHMMDIPDILTPLLGSCGSTLRSLEIVGFKIPVTFRRDLTTKAPVLASLSAQLCVTFGDDEQYPLRLAELHTLSLDYGQQADMEVLRNGDYPSLRCLKPRGDRAWGENLEAYPPPPRVPDLQVFFAWSYSAGAIFGFLKYYPKVDTLIVSLESVDRQLNGQFHTFSNPHLRQIGITDAEMNHRSVGEIGTMLDLFSDQKQFPKVNHIRLCMIPILKMDFAFWHNAISRLRGLGIRFDDVLGNAIVTNNGSSKH